MVVDDLWLGLLLIPKCDLPQLNCLVRGCRDQDLLGTIVRFSHLLAEHVSDVVLVRWELFHCRALVEAEQVDFVVHSSQSI